MSRVILSHPEMGIYLGSFLGMGFWSKLDDVDQDHAVTFENAEDAVDYINSWIDIPENITFIQVPTDKNFIEKELIKEYW